jgi:hypothetical protein
MERATAIASPTVSPAMNRRAKLFGRRMPYREARRLMVALPARRANAVLGSASNINNPPASTTALRGISDRPPGH